MASDAAGYEWALEQAHAAGDSDAIEQLEAIGQPPYTIDEFVTQRRFVAQFGGSMIDYKSDFELLRISMATSEFAWPDAGPLVRGISFSSEAIWDEQQTYDAADHIQRLDVPYFLMVGRHDHIIPSSLSAEFFDGLEATEKELIWFEESAHVPFFEEPDTFNQEVLRIAQQIEMLER